MKYLLTFVITLFAFVSFSQGYVQVKENEPFKRADMIIIESDTIPKNAFTIVAKTLVKYGFILDKLMPEYGTITTELRESRAVELKINVIISDTEIKLFGSYASLFPTSSQPLALGTMNNPTSPKTMLLDYRNDLSIYFDEMTEIAKNIKEIINAKKLIYVERGLTTKY